MTNHDLKNLQQNASDNLTGWAHDFITLGDFDEDDSNFFALTAGSLKVFADTTPDDMAQASQSAVDDAKGIIATANQYIIDHGIDVGPGSLYQTRKQQLDQAINALGGGNDFISGLLAALGGAAGGVIIAVVLLIILAKVL